MIHNLLLRLSEGLPFSPPLVVGVGAALIIVLTLWLSSRSRGTILFCLAIGLMGAGLIVGLVGVQVPGEPLLWGQVEKMAERVIGPPAFRRLEQVTTVTFALALGALFLVYNLTFQEKPGERPRRMLEQDTAQRWALGSAHLCKPGTFRRWSKHDPSGWMMRGRFWGAGGQKIGNRFCLSGEDIARGVAVFGAQGSGKTQSVILPAIADRMRDGHNLIVTDVQGELLPYIRKIATLTGHAVLVHNPSEPQHSCVINLCEWVNTVADAQATSAILLSGGAETGNNAFWARSAAVFLAACILHYPSLGAILVARRDPHQMARDLRSSHHPAAADLAADFCNSMESREPKLAHNILITTFSLGLERFTSRAIRSITDHAGPDIAWQMTRLPLVVILSCDLGHTQSFGPYLGAILRALTTRLDGLGRQEAEGRLPIPVGLILEEFPALGRLDSLVRDINMVRKRRISILTAAQSLAQFDSVYPGKGEADQLLAGLATKIVLGGCDQRTAEFFSRVSGQQTLALSSLSQSGGRGDQKARSTGTASLRGRALLLPDDIIRPERGYATVFAAYTHASLSTGSQRGGAAQAIFHARLAPFFRRRDWKKLKKVQPKAPLTPPQPIREGLPGRLASTPEREPIRLERELVGSEREPELDIAEMW